MKYRFAGILILLTFVSVAIAQEQSPLTNLPANTWVKLTPLKDTPPSPRLGYEGACVWDSVRQRVIRYGGHNQGGGGEQNSEMWSFDPRTAKWQLHEPNLQPPGICCGQQNVFDPIRGQYIRFPAFSASHGWQWLREVYLNNTSIWTYDPPSNHWRMIRPFPTAHPSPLRCASWDRENQVVVMFGGEGNSEGTQVYDPHTNEWFAMKPKVQPEFRSGGSLAYDEAHRQHVLFGSQFNDDKHTWMYDLRTNTWQDMQPPEMPPTNKNDAVLTYDSAAEKVIAIIKETSGEDEKAKHVLFTWSYDLATNRWKKLDPAREPDPTGSRARQLMFAPELGVSLLENRPSNSSGVAEQQIWAFRSAGERKQTFPTKFSDINVVTKKNAAQISWKIVGDEKPASLTLFRAQGERPWKLTWSEMAQLKPDDRTYVDDSVKPGERYFYYLTALRTNSLVLAASPHVRTQPAADADLTVSVRSPREVRLAWSLPDAEREDIAGYHVERAVVEVYSDDQLKRLKSQTPPLESPSVGMIRRVGSFERLTKEPVAKAEFVDSQVDLNTPATIEGEPLDQRKASNDDLDADGRQYRFGVYAYRVRAVNALGVEGGASSAVLTIPAAPQFVFAKEDGMKCHLKWQPNAEEKLQGYRVYRMDGRYAKDAIPQLTHKPIKELAFTDEEAGKATRRYHVVAVDAIGQEGFPSSPVWFEREWKEFYKPFAGEWHQ